MKSLNSNWFSVNPQAAAKIFMAVNLRMKIRKIDARNKLYGNFVWQIRLDSELFFDVRDWCWATWGPAVDYVWWEQYGVKRNNVNWSFDSGEIDRFKKRVIYLRSDEELTLFQLKWS